MTTAGHTFVVGRDATGAAYGAFELAERLRETGPDLLPLASPILGSPAVQVRAANLFIVLPDIGESRWWFHEADFWREYLDLLFRSRMNFLDLHAMYNLRNTVFPNALLYFARSKSFPDVGIAEPDRQANLESLRMIIAMAAARGIRVGLMSYRADTSLTGDSNDFPLDDAMLKQYTREAVADVARNVPDLWRMGFRIGESQRDAGWYADSFVAGLHDSGTKVLPYTRSWQIGKNEILSLINATGDDYILEAKFNGEQLAAPYAIAGGNFSKLWNVYSYQDYLEQPAPYTFVFQVRTCSTHRIFRYASYERTRRTVEWFNLGRVRGFTLEAPHAYYPQRDFYHSPGDVFSPWTFRRDELMYLLFGRLSYDMKTPESVFRAALAERVGESAAPVLWEAMQAASDIVPWIQMANTCGADTRDYAPELEWGGTVAQWAQMNGHIFGFCNYRAPFDTFAIASPHEAATDLVNGRPGPRLGPVDVSRIVLDDASRARLLAASVQVDPDNAEARDILRETGALAALGDYFGHKLRGAESLAVYSMTGSLDYLDYARTETQIADASFVDLAAHTSHIAPFEEFLRMNNLGLGKFHWNEEVPLLPRDPASIDDLVEMLRQRPPAFIGSLPPAADALATPRAAPPSLALDVQPRDPAAPMWTVTIDLGSELPKGSSVRLLWKKFSGFSDWQSIPANGSGKHYTAVVKDTGGRGAMFAVDVQSRPDAWRLPDITRATPYLSLPPR